MGGFGAFSMGGGGGGGSEDGGLTDAERMLLKMCQDQAAESQAEKQQQAASAAASVIAEPTTERPDAGLEPAQRLRNASKDYAKTVEALQKKLSSSRSVSFLLLSSTVLFADLQSQNPESEVISPIPFSQQFPFKKLHLLLPSLSKIAF